jgi:hypothetical protein
MVGLVLVLGCCLVTRLSYQVSSYPIDQLLYYAFFFLNEESRQIIRVWENNDCDGTSELLGYE